MENKENLRNGNQPETLPTVKDRIRKFSNPGPSANNQSNSQKTQNSQLTPDMKHLKNRQILQLNIPVHDSEKAGLGISVKGKTGANNGKNTSGSSTKSTDGDLGIFIKSILHGGAASRDGRLKMNDQLVSVNGVSLLHQSNAQAMETLRRAMVQGGNCPGHISLTISRKIASPKTSRSSELNLLNHSTSTQEEINNNDALRTPVNLKPELSLPEFQKGPENGSRRWSNPVLDRLTGGVGGSPIVNGLPNQNNRGLTQQQYGLRNDSYYMATNETWSPTVHLNGSNAVLIEEDPNEPQSP